MIKKISKQMINDIYDEIIKPFYCKIEKGAYLYMDKEKIPKLKIKQGIFIYKLFIQNATLYERMFEIAEIHHNRNIPLEVIQRYTQFFVGLLTIFINKHKNYFENDSYKKLEEFAIYFLNIHKGIYEENEEEFFEDDFFDFDSEEVDSSINNMHYTDERKTTASEFMQEGSIEEESILELKEELDEIEDMIDAHLEKELTYDFLEKIIPSHVILLFNMSVEFKDIGYALETLNEKLSLIDLDSLNSSQKEILKAILITIMEDIKKWKNEVLINQTAQDIHYLDASLLANIAQIDIMLNSFKQNEIEDEDIELF